MYELKKKIGKVFTSKFVGTAPPPPSYEKRIYRAVVSQRLRNTALNSSHCTLLLCHVHVLNCLVLQAEELSV
jgi:hypothetical protein